MKEHEDTSPYISCPFLSCSKVHRQCPNHHSPVKHTFNEWPTTSFIKPQHLGQREFPPSTNFLSPMAASCWIHDMDKAVGSQSPSTHDFNLYFLFFFSIQLLKLVPLYLSLSPNVLFWYDLVFPLSPQRFLAGYTSPWDFFLILAPTLARHPYFITYQFMGFSLIFPKAFTIHIF